MIRPPRIVGRRGFVLLYLGILDLLFALSLWRPAPINQRSPTMIFVADIAPLPWWAGLWLAVGAVCLAGAFVHRVDLVAFTCATAIKTLWGSVFLIGWIAGEVTRGWVSSVIWLGLAAVVMVLAGWPEPVERAK